MNAVNDVIDDNDDGAANDDAVDGGVNIGGMNVQQLLFGGMPQPQPPTQQTFTWPSYHRGGTLGIISERHFAQNVAQILAEKNMPEVTVDSLESGLDTDRVAALCNLFADRHWKSITLIPHFPACQPQTQNQELWSELLNAAIQKTKRLEIRGGLHVACASALATALQEVRSELRVLSMCDCKVTTEVASILGVAVRSSTTLQEFALTKCRLQEQQQRDHQGENAVGTLTALLGTEGGPPSRLQALYLSDCCLQKADVAQIVSSLQSHPRLKKLYLNGTNRFSAQDSHPLLHEGLKNHFELEHVQLPSSHKHCPLIQTYVDRNRGGRRLLRARRGNTRALWPLVLERISKIGRMPAASKASVNYFFVHQLLGQEHAVQRDVEQGQPTQREREQKRDG